MDNGNRQPVYVMLGARDEEKLEKMAGEELSETLRPLPRRQPKKG